MPADSSWSRPRSRNAGNTSAPLHPAPDHGNADTPRSAPQHTARAPLPSAPAGFPPAYPTAGTRTPGRNGVHSPHTPARTLGNAPHPPAAAAPADDDMPDIDPSASASHARSTDTSRDAATTPPDRRRDPALPDIQRHPRHDLDPPLKTKSHFLCLLSLQLFRQQPLPHREHMDGDPVPLDFFFFTIRQDVKRLFLHEII